MSPRSTGPTLGMRQAAYDRDNRRCRRCGTARGPHSLHHRQNRGMGGSRQVNTLSRLVVLCGTGTTGCHGWITEHPAEAYATGWLIRKLSPDDPEQIPLVTVYGERFFLLHSGGVTTLSTTPDPWTEAHS
ncbi:hypothetical protein [Auraticoccus monumenti]|uniref:HNH endonuclease n=1 Tax=Auraticoccus monumenti TaxID=675864 RepID=A0A1G6UPY6_9ACTN|nr:hypothetical protein [Auraticoccus monumenti]SDD42756.1 hypothetical protein SAMN04489747_0926 [Auraticoccus monumenti]